MRLGVLHHLAGDALASVRRTGLQNTLRIIASTVRDAAFDRAYGTDTAGYADPRVYASDDPRAHRATFYVPTRARPFLSSLRHSGIAPTGRFVDFGCGKGGALFVVDRFWLRSAGDPATGSARGGPRGGSARPPRLARRAGKRRTADRRPCAIVRRDSSGPGVLARRVGSCARPASAAPTDGQGPFPYLGLWRSLAHR